MAQLREPDQPAAVEQTHNRVVVHAGRVKKTHRPTSNGDMTEVTLSKARFKVIADKSRSVGKLLSFYADILAAAERKGGVTRVTLEVFPDGETQLIKAADKGDAMDAALAAAKARGQSKVAEILKGEDMLTAREFGLLIGASHETVNVKRKTGNILGLEGTTRGFKYPRWQVTDAGLPMPGLADLFATLGEQSWTVYRFLRMAHAELGGRTALEALKVGQIEEVLGIARNQATGVFG